MDINCLHKRKKKSITTLMFVQELHKCINMGKQQAPDSVHVDTALHWPIICLSLSYFDFYRSSSPGPKVRLHDSSLLIGFSFPLFISGTADPPWRNISNTTPLEFPEYQCQLNDAASFVDCCFTFRLHGCQVHLLMSCLYSIFSRSDCSHKIFEKDRAQF